MAKNSSDNIDNTVIYGALIGAYTLFILAAIALDIVLLALMITHAKNSNTTKDTLITLFIFRAIGRMCGTVASTISVFPIVIMTLFFPGTIIGAGIGWIVQKITQSAPTKTASTPAQTETETETGPEPETRKPAPLITSDPPLITSDPNTTQPPPYTDLLGVASLPKPVC